MNRLKKVTLYRKDTMHSVNEAQVTVYQYDKRGLVTKEINAAGNETLYVYDGNGNLAAKTDADGYVTEYGYDPRNLVETINYNNSKNVVFEYNANGEIVEMQDWNGVTSFALDVLDRIISVNDHNGKVTGYTYDEAGNKKTMAYPDNSTVTYTYDLLNRLVNVKDAENQNTVYNYDAASRLTSQVYPNGWAETFTYDNASQMLTQVATDPTNTPSKTITHNFAYDAQGNITHEARGGAGGQEKYDLTHTYDALNRLTGTTGLWGYKAHSYTYDSLGNLTYEQIHNKGTEYWHNNLNQQVQKKVDGKELYTYSFDGRGNLTEGIYHKNQNHSYAVETYVYDETNRMALGANEIGETSEYVYNGLGHLVGQVMTVKKNAYGYTALTSAADLFSFEDFVAEYASDIEAKITTAIDTINFLYLMQFGPGGGTYTPSMFSFEEQPLAIAIEQDLITDFGTAVYMLPRELVMLDGTLGGNLNQTSVVEKNFVLDYASPLAWVILESESGVGGLDYRYVYGLQKLSVSVSPVANGAGSIAQNGKVKLWYHQDRLGSVDYITDNVQGKAISYVTYDDWGALTMKAILKMGVRELDLVTEYTGHPYDPVLAVYYARARMYDAVDRRLLSMDPVRGTITNPQTLAQYTYALNNSLKYIDPFGMIFEATVLIEGATGNDITGLNYYLFVNNYLNEYTYQYLDTGRYGRATTQAIMAFQKAYNLSNAPNPGFSALRTDGSVDAATWRAMGFSVNKTLEEEFWRGKKGNSTISVTIYSNIIKIDYNPKIFITEEYTRYIKNFDPSGRAYYERFSCVRRVSDSLYTKYEKLLTEGFKEWENAGKQVFIQGVRAFVYVNVDFERVSKRSDANLKIDLDCYFYSMVTSTLDWSTSKTPQMHLNFGTSSGGTASDARVKQVAQHEFGHVLGLFDAYQNALYTNSIADIKYAKDEDVMLGGKKAKGAQTVYSYNIEMMLYAFKNNQLQNYANGSVAGVNSEVYFRSGGKLTF